MEVKKRKGYEELEMYLLKIFSEKEKRGISGQIKLYAEYILPNVRMN